MKTILFALAAAGLAATARANHVEIRGNINLGGPVYASHGYVAPGGYWRDVAVRVWVPPHWEARHDGWGRRINVWAPGHYEMRTRRVWVDAYAHRRDRERWEREHRARGHDRHWDRR